MSNLLTFWRAGQRHPRTVLLEVAIYFGNEVEDSGKCSCNSPSPWLPAPAPHPAPSPPRMGVTSPATHIMTAEKTHPPRANLLLEMLHNYLYDKWFRPYYRELEYGSGVFCSP